MIRHETENILNWPVPEIGVEMLVFILTPGVLFTERDYFINQVVYLLVAKREGVSALAPTTRAVDDVIDPIYQICHLSINTVSRLFREHSPATISMYNGICFGYNCMETHADICTSAFCRMSFDDIIEVFELAQREDEEPRRQHLRRILRDRSNPLEEYDEWRFVVRYRLSKESTIQLLDMLYADIESPTETNCAIPPTLKLCAALRFFACGTFQGVVGDLHGVSQSSISRHTFQVTEAICARKRTFIDMPSGPDANDVLRGFEELAGMPGIIGCIDCTHIPILNPGGPHAQRFINRKGWHSINTQVVCDHRLRLINIVARWYGSAHDSRIFNASTLRQKFENGLIEGVLLGDSGYEATTYMLTPIANPQTRLEKNYNKAHRTTRNTVERSFGVYKKRFPSVAFGNRLRLRLDRCMATIVATACLHNLALTHNDPLPTDEMPVMMEENMTALISDRNEDALLFRQRYVDQAFGTRE